MLRFIFIWTATVLTCYMPLRQNLPSISATQDNIPPFFNGVRVVSFLTIKCFLPFPWSLDGSKGCPSKFRCYDALTQFIWYFAHLPLWIAGSESTSATLNVVSYRACCVTQLSWSSFLMDNKSQSSVDGIKNRISNFNQKFIYEHSETKKPQALSSRKTLPMAIIRRWPPPGSNPDFGK